MSQKSITFYHTENELQRDRAKTSQKRSKRKSSKKTHREEKYDFLLDEEFQEFKMPKLNAEETCELKPPKGELSEYMKEYLKNNS